MYNGPTSSNLIERFCDILKEENIFFSINDFLAIAAMILFLYCEKLCKCNDGFTTYKLYEHTFETLALLDS
jgi:hypothetical protein